jgi:ABC-type transporter Mla subunit MlaD
MAAYRFVERTTTLSAAVADAVAELVSLGEEAREIVDNASENLQQTQRIQTFEETAEALENLNEPDSVESTNEIPVYYHEGVPTRKRGSVSRQQRCNNAVNMLQAASHAIAGFLDENDGHEDTDDLDFLRNEIDDIVNAAEGCEFPGMFCL